MKAEVAASIARHKEGCALARKGEPLPLGAPLETRAGYEGERRRMAEAEAPPRKPTIHWRERSTHRRDV